jgi:hypothetical protein
MNAGTHGRIFKSSEFAAWAAAIRQQESTDNYSCNEDEGKHLGAYQMSTRALQDAGFQDARGNWTDLARSFGVESANEFLANHEAQDFAFTKYTAKNWHYLGLRQSDIGATIDGVYITEPGLLAGAHLVGYHAVEIFLSSKGTVVPQDWSNPRVPVTSYLKNFGSFDFTYDEAAESFVNTSNKIPERQTATAPVQQNAALHARVVAIGKARATSVAPVHPRFLKKPPRGPMRPEAGPAPGFQAKHSDRGIVRQDQPQRSAGILGVETSPPNRRFAPDAAPVSASEGLSFLQSESFREFTRHAAEKNRPGHQLALRQAAKLSSALGWRDRQSGIDQRSVAQIRPRFLPRGIVGSRDHQSPLPSVAPIRRDNEGHLGTQQPAMQHADGGLIASGQRPAPIAGADKKIDQLALRGALAELLERQGRLPPSGASAFDPLLTPAWPGLQVPA